MQVQVTPTASTNNEIRYLVWFDKSLASMIGNFIRPEGTLERGLVLHCNAPPRRGQTYSAQINPKSAMMHVELPASYGKAGEPKIRTVVNAESTTVDGETVIVLDRVEPARWASRTPRHIKLGARSKQHTAPIEYVSASATGDVNTLRQAMHVLKARVRDPALAAAIIAVCNNAPVLHAELGWNGTEMTARIVQSL